ncbi:general transcription factor 3C polypeptide 6 [Bufo gargarizans]|uniref:general transcription factor 3C polypeptide 6 n=1 Tax=Bufo gargarizans TaxID=30331 RepID=UPI001CF5BAFB|nr:general transcription factor 3C polypeptide 6 [Bufo gargarizans]XP_044135874.1 general transcription factor 3C polypeptide 6 [Bufo gargarizans]XP_044135875.1 general transcription factor 3C polypeptide 6 [Bufo gargarizans]XP_044135876.1 general transcription factor 3C polypeptide 6 [Bufo gargarizans]XP_044135877.1 general transcription factor 3C polypeptide 6 [Bufo gargarizans]XP_044135878.1 general transcription factor 3C polypeptide 6 [Bufo gargarizans]XP_044135879.1 general transcriptio
MASNTIPASYQHNTSTGSECLPDDNEEEEEEQLVLVELTGIIDSDILEKCDNKCKILGINTEKPILQVDKYVFAGQYEDALGTCVIFEESPDQGDGESTKPKLKYKCHTVKKLNMTRTFLTEKKEGEEGGGKIEWFQIKDDSSAGWPQMICSFAQENEDAGESQSEEDDNGQLDVSNEETGQADQSFYSDGKQHSSDLEKGPSEGRMHLDPEEVESNINRLIPAAEQEARSAEDAGSPREDETIHHDQKS